MPRTSNIFYKLVEDENSTTELLCNLMRFAAFRRPLLTQFLSKACAAKIIYDDIDTQFCLPGLGRPDITISNYEVCALVEVKVWQDTGLTDNQPDSYFSYLLSADKGLERWLVFLVPEDWIHLESLNKSLHDLKAAHRDESVNINITHWEDVLDVIEDNDLHALNPFLGNFHKLLVDRYRPTPVVFSRKEVDMLFNHDIPAALWKLSQLIDQVQVKSSICNYKSQRTPVKRTLWQEEYGFYFTNSDDQTVLWFGVSTGFWQQEGFPLCLGVENTWSTVTREAFCASYKGGTKQFDDYTMGWISQKDLEGENAVEQVWAQLHPVLEAVVGASA